jgi:hypothetical protein
MAASRVAQLIVFRKLTLFGGGDIFVVFFQLHTTLVPWVWCVMGDEMVRCDTRKRGRRVKDHHIQTQRQTVSTPIQSPSPRHITNSQFIQHIDNVQDSVDGLSYRSCHTHA